VRSTSETLLTPRNPRLWALCAIFSAIGGSLSFGIITTEMAASGETVPWLYILVLELDGAFMSFLLVPFALWFMSSHLIRRDNWPRQVPRHLLATLVYGVSHTLLMWGSRIVLFRLLGWGEYDFGLMRYRFPMEYQKQFMLYWGLYCVVALISSARRNQAERTRAVELEKKLTQARLDALKMQLNPHFLFNTLNMISSYVFDDPRLADSMIGHLSDFLRVTLRHSGLHEVTLEQELEFLASYLAIMKARFEERLEVEMGIAPPTKQALVPHLLLQPLVENSVTHCTKDHSRPGSVKIRSAIEGSSLRLTVQDNGPGLGTQSGEVFGRGVGLSNTSARLHELYGDECSLELVDADNGGLMVVIDLPFRTALEGEAPG